MNSTKTGSWMSYLFLISIMLGGCAVAPVMSDEEKAAAEKFQPAPGFGNVYVVRKLAFTGYGVAFRVDVDGQFIGSIVPKAYHLLELKPGQYSISVTTKDSEDHEVVDVVEGENYFLKVEPVFSWNIFASIERIDAAQGRELVLAGDRLDTLPLKYATPGTKAAPKFSFPGRTVASDALKHDIMYYISIFVLSSGCQSFNIVNTKIVGLEGEFTVDERNRLLSGEADEIWTADQCGINKDYYINLKPDGKGGTNFAVNDRPTK